MYGDNRILFLSCCQKAITIEVAEALVGTMCGHDPK